MRIALVHLAIAAPALIAALPVQAQVQPQPFETAATATIESGDYARAERILVRQLKHRADEPELLLNLAAVYLNTNRATEAQALYQRVLSLEDVAMELPSGASAGSHAVARTGLRRIATPTQLSNR